MRKGRFPEEQVIKVLNEQAAGRLRRSINPVDPCCGSKWSFQKDRKEKDRAGEDERRPGGVKVD